MADQSVGGMVMKLSADGSSFTRGLEKAQRDAKAFENSMRSMQANLSRLSNMAMGALGIGSVGQVLRESLAAYRESEQAEKKLAAVLHATGNAAGWSVAQLKDYAEELENVTNYEDDATIAAMALMAKFQNISGQTFKDAIRLSQDMASVMGTDLESAVMKVGKALNDPINGLGALGKQGDKVYEQQQKQIEAFLRMNEAAKAQGVVLNVLKGSYENAAQAMADPLTQAGNQWGKLSEQIGESVSKALLEFERLIGGYKNLAGRTQAIGIDLEIWAAKHNKWMYENMPMFSSFAQGIGMGGPVPQTEQSGWVARGSISGAGGSAELVWKEAAGFNEYIAQLEKAKADFLAGKSPGGTAPMPGGKPRFDLPVDKDAIAKQKELAKMQEHQRELEQKFLHDYIDDAIDAASKIRQAVEPLEKQFERTIAPAMDLVQRGYLDKGTAATFAKKEMQSLLGGLSEVSGGDRFTPNMTQGSREAVRAIQGGMNSPAEKLVRIGEKQVTTLSAMKDKLEKLLAVFTEKLPEEGTETP